MKLIFPATLGLVTAIALSGAAGAQTKPAAAAPAAAPAQTGPMIPGVCIYNSQAALTGSAVGQSVIARLKQLATAVESELKGEAASLDAEAKAIDAARANTPQDQWEQRALAFRQKAAAFDRKRQQRAQELQATQAKQFDRVDQAIEPILQQIYNEKGCSILLERASLYGANPNMDVTGLVVTRLNAKITTMTFERERAEAQQGAAAAPRPAATAPVAAAPAPKKK